MRIVGLDIGGANLKAVLLGEKAHSMPFALWKNPADLPKALAELVAPLQAESFAVTMTGELCDCFPNKSAGVAAILDAVETVANGRAVAVWSMRDRFVDTNEARYDPLAVAAANWHALARFVELLIGPALLIDVGSTTSDIIPVPFREMRTDLERLREGSLVYTGTRRTPLCALLGNRGAAEFFATTQDVYLILGMTPEDPADYDTADGRGRTRSLAFARLARMLCADPEMLGEAALVALAERLCEEQVTLLAQAIAPHRPTRAVLAGSGEFLAMLAWQRAGGGEAIRLSERLGPEYSVAACALAVAELAAAGVG